MNQIKIPIILGPKSKLKLITPGYQTLTMKDKTLVTRTFYEYEGPSDEMDDASPVTIQMINEQTYLLKSSINKIGIGWDNEDGCCFVQIGTNGGNYFVNVEDDIQGNSVVNKLVDWWLNGI